MLALITRVCACVYDGVIPRSPVCGEKLDDFEDE
jgi:hypothetical protein